MANKELGFKEIKATVIAILLRNEEARKSDVVLITEVLKENGVDVTKPFVELAEGGYLARFETIRRARQKVQAEHPELKDAEVAALRAEKEMAFYQDALDLDDGGAE